MGLIFSSMLRTNKSKTPGSRENQSVQCPIMPYWNQRPLKNTRRKKFDCADAGVGREADG